MKTNRFIAIPILVISVLVLSACRLPFISVKRGSGELISQTREVSGFNAIRLDGAGRLVITQGDSETLEIEAEDNLIDDLTSEVRGQTLVLGFQDQPWQRTIIPTEGITYTLTVIDLNEITFNGAGDLEMEALETPSLDLIINGAAQVNIDDLMADALSVQISGTGTVDIAGQVPTQTVNINGAGNFDAGDLQTSSTEIDINGLGNGTVWATESLDISINGGGTVNYYGSPDITQNINGLGDINNRGEK